MNEGPRPTSTHHGHRFALVLLLTAAPLVAQPFTLTPCAIDGVAGEARCGTYEVFENRETLAGRTIPLKVVVLPATGADKAPDPLVFFAGGPGDNATGSAAGFAQGLPAVRASRDIVLIDVRGTGGSRALVCDSMMGATGAQKFLDDFLPVDSVEACRRQWEGQTDFTRYTTAELVDDVAEVLRALGYAQANLLGGSYGTRAAQAFAARHPEQVRTMILEGVVANDDRMPISIARDAQNALDGWFAECAADTECHGAFPRLGEEFAAVLERVRRAPVEVQILDPESGQKVPLRLNDKGFGQTVRYMLYLPTTSIVLPLYIHLAAQGDFQPLAETAYLFAARLSGAGLADGLYLSVLCAEDVPFIDSVEIPAAIAGTFLGDFRIERQRAACAAWPARKLGSEILAPLRSPIPTLLLSGERDPVTPAAGGTAVASGLSRSRHLIIPDGAHSFEGLVGADECVGEVTARFLAAGSVDGLDTACVDQIRRPPFLLKLERPGDLKLSAAEQQRFVGSYAGLGEAPTPVTVADGQLRMTAPDGQSYALLPVTATRFVIAGAPPGFVVEFLVDDQGKVIGCAVEQGPGRRTELRKQVP
jgi:pimeloyl-ACP methyl ester carboxylesterase